MELNISSKEKHEKTQDLLGGIVKNRLPDVAYSLSIYFYKLQAYPEAVFYGKLIAELRNKEKPIDSLLFRKSISNLALFLYKNNNLNESRKFCNLLISQKQNDKYTGRAYYRLGLMSEHEGDYYITLEYYKKAKELYKKNGLIKDVINISTNIARVYILMDDADSNKKGKKIIKELEDLPKNAFTNKQLLEFYLTKGNIYSHKTVKNKGESIASYNSALLLAEQQNNEHYRSILLNNIGYTYLQLDPEKAKKYLISGLKQSKEAKTKGMFLHNLSTYHFKRANYDKAISNLKESIFAYLSSPKKTSFKDIPMEEYEFSNNKNNILEAFLFLIEYQNQHRNSEEELDLIYQHISIAEEIIDHIRFENDDQKSKFLWLKEASRLYEKAVKTAYLSKDPEKAFYFMEKNKALLLLEDITDHQIKKNANLPGTIINREKKIKKRYIHCRICIPKRISVKKIV